LYKLFAALIQAQLCVLNKSTIMKTAFCTNRYTFQHHKHKVNFVTKRILLSSLFLFVIGCISVFSQNVGIGTTTPAYPLDVAGTINTSNDAYVGGALGIGTKTPSYKMQVENGSFAIHSSTDLKYWILGYNSAGNYFNINEGGIPRVVIANGGNVGIGTAAPAVKLDVAGNTNVGGNITASGNVTVNGGNGIVSSWNGSQIKYYTQQSSVHAVLGAFGTSIEGTIAWPSGMYTSAPQVLVGDITSTGGTVGQLYRVQMITYSATANGCKFRLINTSNGSVDYNITWNIVLLGK
jgi:hypothetical protein